MGKKGIKIKYFQGEETHWPQEERNKEKGSFTEDRKVVKKKRTRGQIEKELN